tara:strand:+ start:333 stop:641 length:309 start_codon:yes stop_codon:yes gene_type:complete
MNWFARWGILALFGLFIALVLGDGLDIWSYVGGLLIITAILGSIFTAIISANHALIDSMVASESSSQEDIIVICPHCEAEINVGTDEDDLYECPSCGQDFEY